MSKIFKAYDIRGIYPSEINENIIYKIAFSYAVFLNLKGKKVVIGRDIRKSSPNLIEKIIEGLTDAGVNVVDIGLASTPMLYFANGKLKADGSIILTASHNPKEFNGMKLCREEAIPISGDTGIKEIEKLVEKNIFEKVEKKGNYEKNEEIKQEYINFIKSFAKLGNKKLKIVIDSANSMGILEKKVLENLDLEIINLYDEFDGDFPNHEGNPLDYSTLKDLQKKVIETKADLGISFDGDADRVGFVDEKGQIIEPDFIGAIIAREILKQKNLPKKISDFKKRKDIFLFKAGEENILYDLRTSLIVPEIIEKNFGNPIESRVGHAFIKEIMRKKDAIFASELSGHYYFKNNFYTESSSLASIYILNLLSNSKKTISEIIEKLKKYYKTPEINFKVNNKEKILEKIEKKYIIGKKIKIDGLKIKFDNWWFSIRASNTENLLRLNLEAKTKEKMQEKLEEIKKYIN